MARLSSASSKLIEAGQFVSEMARSMDFFLAMTAQAIVGTASRRFFYRKIASRAIGRPTKPKFGFPTSQIAAKEILQNVWNSPQEKAGMVFPNPSAACLISTSDR